MKGGVVAFPTDTVYGLGADPFQDAAVERVFAIKGRSSSQALPLLLADVSQLEAVAQNIPELAWMLAERFWPGALTLVLAKAYGLNSLAVPGDTVAVRLPNHPVPRALAAALGRPITGTSANLSGRPSPTSADEVRQQLGGSVDLVLEGSPLPGGQESTILDLTGERPHLLRQGAVALEDIEKVRPLALRATTELR